MHVIYAHAKVTVLRFDHAPPPSPPACERGWLLFELAAARAKAFDATNASRAAFSFGQ
eukprot:gene17351-16570_t